MAQVITARSQSERMRAALQFYGRLAQHDFLIVTRHDLTLLSPITSWSSPSLEPNRVYVGSKCEPRTWQSFHCTSDIFYVIPRPLLEQFNDSIGVQTHRACCFNECASFSVEFRNTGHGCYQAFMDNKLKPEQIGFLWPQVKHWVSEKNRDHRLPR